MGSQLWSLADLSVARVDVTFSVSPGGPRVLGGIWQHLYTDRAHKLSSSKFFL